MNFEMLHQEIALWEGHCAFATFEIVWLMRACMNASLIACLEAHRAQTTFERFTHVFVFAHIFMFSHVFIKVLFVGCFERALCARDKGGGCCVKIRLNYFCIQEIC